MGNWLRRRLPLKVEVCAVYIFSSILYRLSVLPLPQLPPLQQWLGRNGFARLLQLQAGSTVLESRRGAESLHWSQTARGTRRWLRRGNVDPPYRGEKRVEFLAILAMHRMVIWETRNKGFYEDANFLRRDLIFFFKHQLRAKIRCDRKILDRLTFDKRSVHAASLVARTGQRCSHPFLFLLRMGPHSH